MAKAEAGFCPAVAAGNLGTGEVVFAFCTLVSLSRYWTWRGFAASLIVGDMNFGGVVRVIVQ
jgi:hypothetical protein